MPRLLGIDITRTAIRTAAVHSSLRRLELLGTREVVRHEGESLSEVLRALLAEERWDAIAVNFPGDETYVRRLPLPAAALKEIDTVVALEMEAVLPQELDSGVIAHRTVGRDSASKSVTVLAVLAPMGSVRARIELVRIAIGQEPDQVVPGASALASLVSVVPEIESLEAASLWVHIEDDRAELLFLVDGRPVHQRTLSRGTLHAAAAMANVERELRSAILAFEGEHPNRIEKIWMTGEMSAASPLAGELSSRTGIAVEALPMLAMLGANAEGVAVDRCAKAIGLALSLTGRSQAMNLRAGALETERLYPFIRDKIPVFVGLGATILASFVFSQAVELSGLEKDEARLQAELAMVTKELLGHETTDPDEARDLYERGPASQEDPLPKADAFDVMLALSNAVDKSVVHDVLDFEFSKGKATIQATVPGMNDAGTIVKALDEHPCFKGLKEPKTSQFSEGRHKYQIEFEVRCQDKKKKPEPSAAPKDSGALKEGAADEESDE